MMDINEDLLKWFIIFFVKTSGSRIKNENMSDQKLAEVLRKPVIRKFEESKVHSLFKDVFWGADQVDMQLISKFNKRYFFFYYMLLIFIANMHGLFL